jgi:serine/threonine-protein kinase
VIKQNPPAGTVLASGSTVAITLSSGPPPGVVPTVAGETEATAKAELKRAGFHFTTSPTSSTSVKTGDVVSTSPAGGSSSPRGSTVTLLISTGAPLVQLPDVKGLTFTNAQTILIANGFKVSKVKQPDEFAPGQVLFESPSGPKAPQGSTVILTVSSAPTSVLVPDEVGQTESTAVEALKNLGLSATTSPVTVSDPTQNGLVVRELPHPGSSIKKSVPVTLEIGNYVGTTGQSGTGSSGTSNTGQSNTTGTTGTT